MDELQRDVFEEPSKSELKRRAEHLQEVGKQLTELKKEILPDLGLPEQLLEAVLGFHQMRSWGARRRQLQLIGKIMRSVDELAITQAIDMATGNDKMAVATLHRAEQLRDALIEDDKALTPFIENFPEVDIQEVRSLIRNARREKASGKPPKAYRALYKTIHNQLKKAPIAPNLEETKNE